MSAAFTIRPATQADRLSIRIVETETFYHHIRAAGFISDYQGQALQALARGKAPVSWRLVCAPAFSGL